MTTVQFTAVLGSGSYEVTARVHLVPRQTECDWDEVESVEARRSCGHEISLESLVAAEAEIRATHVDVDVIWDELAETALETARECIAIGRSGSEAA